MKNITLTKLLITVMIFAIVLTGCSKSGGNTEENRIGQTKTETRPENVGLAKAKEKTLPDITLFPDEPTPDVTLFPDEPTPTAEPTSYPTADEITYYVYTFDIDTGYVLGDVTLQVCDDETCRLFTSDDGGEVSFTGTSQVYTITVYECPDGYEPAWDNMYVTTDPEDSTHAYSMWFMPEQEAITERMGELNTPDFVVYDLYGSEYRLSDFAGKPIVVNVWATWCGPCVSELPHFQKLYEEYGDEVQFLMVNCEIPEDRDYVLKFLEEYGYTFPVYYDDDWSVDTAYGTGYIPYTITIDRDGYMHQNEVGSQDEDVLRKFIEEINR